MSKLISELDGFRCHAMSTGQEQVADLIGWAVDALEKDIRIAELEDRLETLRMSALNALSIMPSGKEKADLRDAYDQATEILEVCDE